MYSDLDDSYRYRNRAMKIGVITVLAVVVMWATITLSVVYSNAFILVTVMCILVAPIPIALCHEEYGELFYSDRSVAKDMVKGAGYVTFATCITMAFGAPLILLFEGEIGPDMFAWSSMVAFAGGMLDTMIVHAIVAGM